MLHFMEIYVHIVDNMQIHEMLKKTRRTINE